MRIELTDTPLDSIIKMSEGNPGAMNFMMMAISEDPMNVIKLILPLDTLELYGPKAYMLWNDCCDRDLSRVHKVLDAWREGRISKEEIQTNLSRGRGTPFVLDGVTL